MGSVVGIAGSIRKGSFNAALLRAAAEVVPAGTSVDIASIAEIPLYDGDVESAGIPAPVVALRERIAAADGLLLVSPEYNHSIPGVLKNAIDWLSRPPSEIERVFGDLPVAIMGASTGRGGTRFAQSAWLPVLAALGTRPWFDEELYVAGASKVFDEHGALVDETVRKLLTSFMHGFADFVESEAAGDDQPAV